MSPDLSEKNLHIIEAICEQGCTHVHRLLCKAKKGVEIEELSDCSQHETELIINELKQIMSIYGDRDCKPD
jgi:hypothetical protein